MSASRILIVEDEAIVALELEHRLVRQGYTIAGTARSADEAVSIVADQTIDLALLDLRLRGKRDGIDVARELRERDIPFVFLTAHGDDETLARVKAVEPQGYLLKPFDERLLRLTIETAVHRHASERARVAAERARRSAEAMQATILEHSPYGVLVVSLELGLLLANRAAIELFGLEPGQLPDSVVELLPCMATHDLRAACDERCVQRVEGRRRDGQPLQVEVACGSVPLDEGERVILIVRDLAPQLRLEEHVLRASRLEVAGRVAAGIVHDLNNLLSVVWMSAYMLQRAAPDELPSLRKDLESGISLGAGLTTRLLSITRPIRTEPRVLAVNEALHGITKLVRRAIKPEVELHLDLAPDTGATKIDPIHFDQLILNLALNADHAMPEGGRLTLRSRRADDRIVLDIEDTGTGIDESIRERLFEPFVTTGGSGLGLSIVKDIVERVAGRVDVASNVPQGARFRVELERAGDSRSEEPAAARAVTPLEGQDRVILLVDDDELHARALARLLEGKRFRAVRARGPGDALLIAERTRETVALAILDVEMPYMDGLELAERLDALHPGLPIVLLSGTQSMSESKHAAAILRKPIEPEQLFDVLARILPSEAER